MGEKTFEIAEQHPVLEEKLLSKDGLQHLEYKLIPLYVWQIEKKNADVAILYDFSAWSQDLIRRMYSTKLINWNEIVCEIMGNPETECLVVYDFPEPFKVPLAKYGAVYINRQKKMYGYITLEKSFDGYMICTSTTEKHYILGKRKDMSKEEFVKEVCRGLEADRANLETRQVVRM